MKVLSILAATSNPLGMIFTHRQIDSLEKLGVENQSFYIPAHGLTFGKLLKSVVELRKAVRQFNPDIIHVQYGMIYAFIAAFTNLRPLVITFHGSDLNTLPGESFRKKFQKKFLSNLAVLRAKEVICVSDGVRKNLWWKSKNANIIPLGIDLHEFRPMDRAAARRQLQWSEEEVVVLFNANNPVIKRLDMAEQTMTIVKESIPGARLEVLYGKQDNSKLVPVLLNASNCLLLCSDSEGSPTMVKEALACDLPVVGVDVGDVKLRLEGVQPSRVVEREPHALARAIIEVVKADRPSNGREKLVSDCLTEEAVAEVIHDVYMKIIRHKKKATLL
jgi:teichuronic acid biosynthesis glycosyltransferase TuaC